jgi:predicted PurR-regulated permease PerM
MGKYKHEILLVIFLLTVVLSGYYLYGIVLPFFIGLVLAFAVAPIIKWFQKRLRNWSASVLLFLVLCTVVSILGVTLMANYVNNDFKRFSNSFTVLVADNQHAMDETTQKVQSVVGRFFNREEIEGRLRSEADSLAVQFQHFDFSTIDTKAIESSLQQMFSGLGTNDEEMAKTNRPSFGVLTILFSTIMYFVLILFNFSYFDSIASRYFKPSIKSKMSVLVGDFNQSFVRYFQLRSKIVFLLGILYLATFLILDIPGTVLLTILIILLSYIPYFQYLALLPLSLGCLVLSTEGDHSFLFYFGIILGVFVVASLLEELLLNPRIMEKSVGMNPVIMVLAISIWGYLLGFTGVLIGIPLTSLMIIYFKRFILPAYQEVTEA